MAEEAELVDGQPDVARIAPAQNDARARQQRGDEAEVVAFSGILSTMRCGIRRQRVQRVEEPRGLADSVADPSAASLRTVAAMSACGARRCISACSAARSPAPNTSGRARICSASVVPERACRR